MRTKIAVFGSEEFCQRALEFTKERKEIVLENYPYKVPSEAPDLLKTLRPCDAILFSGSLPYLASETVLESIPVPSVYMKQDETEIAMTLLALSLRQNYELAHLSIDVRDTEILQNVLADIQTEGPPPFIHSLEENYILDEVLAFHQSAAEQHGTQIAVTSVHAVHDKLIASGFHAVKMISVKSSFLQTIDFLCQEVLLQQSETSKIAVGLLKTEQTDAVEQLTRLLHAHCIQSEEGILFYTTVGAIQSAVLSSDFQQAVESCHGRLAFGSHYTLASAKENAVSALRYMEKEQWELPCLLDENKDLHRLLQHAEEPIELRVIEPILAEIAEKTALSPAVLSKLAQFGQNSQSLQFTANDLASHLGVSRRTAERTIKKLLLSTYVNAVGEEMTYRQGRPRAVYELNFPVY